MDEPASDDLRAEVARLQDEVDRLRALVGPSETAYEQLRLDVLSARDAARGAMATAGTLRGQLAEAHAELARARQDQDDFQRLVWDRIVRFWARLHRAARSRLL